MLANQYVKLPDAPDWSDHVCTGWQGYDDDHRMLCTVDHALQKLRLMGISTGILAVIKLGSWVEMRTEHRQPDLGAGQVKGVRNGKLLVQWRNRPEAEVSHHLVRFAEPPR
jgi:hypothetical protein